MPKELRFADDKARQEMLAVVNELANSVAIAFGPRGQNIVLGKSYGAPTVVKYDDPNLPFFKTNSASSKKTESNTADTLLLIDPTLTGLVS